MSVKITKNGIKLTKEYLEKLNNELRDIREEKNIAYTLSGDTWHDNPGWKKLEQDESNMYKQISTVEDILKNAEVVEWEKKNANIIQIGSSARCHCVYDNFEEEDIFEIVGYGEADLEKGKIIYDSPVAKNILGLAVGEKATFKIPSGNVTYEILNIYDSEEKIQN